MLDQNPSNIFAIFLGLSFLFGFLKFKQSRATDILMTLISFTIIATN